MATTYRPRTLDVRGRVDVDPWCLKWYELRLPGDPDLGRLRPAAVAEIQLAIAEREASPADTGLGFVVLHRGEEAVWLILDLWTGDVLVHWLWRADLDRPDRFELVDAPGPMACVHEMVVQAHERHAFVRHVLTAGDRPDHEAYLADLCTGDPEHRRQALDAFDAAWRAADVERLLSLMSDDPVYAASLGEGPGTVYSGRDDVGRGFASVLAHESAAAGQTVAAEATAGARPQLEVVASPLTDTWVTGWSYLDQREDGRDVVVSGVDVWTFDGHRIAKKDAYRKARR